MALLPYGPSVSNPVFVPRGDPIAGTSLLQALPSDASMYVGIACVATGSVLLLFALLFGPKEGK